MNKIKVLSVFLLFVFSQSLYALPSTSTNQSVRVLAQASDDAGVSSKALEAKKEARDAKRQEVKQIRAGYHQQMKAEKEAHKKKMKALRQEMREKIQAIKGQ